MNRQKPLILIVDDESIFLEILEDLLKDDYQVRTANSGIQALQKIWEHPLPDLILLDFVMPDIDGVSVCYQFKQNPRTAHIPVLFLTANSGIDDEVRGFDVGAVDYIHKPLSPPLLLARLRTHLALQIAQKTLNEQKYRLEQLLEKRNKELEQAQALALSWVESMVFENAGNPERKAFYLDRLKENLNADNKLAVQRLLNNTLSNSRQPNAKTKTQQPDPAAVLAQLDKILKSQYFISAKRMRSLLTFIVKETLDGNANALKAFTIAVEVFRRDSQFDPQQDPLIRVQAGNLRKRLQQYYLTTGKDELVIIAVPKGGYRAVFSIKN